MPSASQIPLRLQWKNCKISTEKNNELEEYLTSYSKQIFQITERRFAFTSKVQYADQKNIRMKNKIRSCT